MDDFRDFWYAGMWRGFPEEWRRIYTAVSIFTLIFFFTVGGLGLLFIWAPLGVVFLMFAFLFICAGIQVWRLERWLDEQRRRRQAELKYRKRRMLNGYSAKQESE